MRGKIRNMETEGKSERWGKICSTVDSFLGGKRSTEA